MITGNPLLQSKIHEDNPPAMSVVMHYYADPIPKSRAPRNLCPTQHRNFDKAFVRKNPLRSRRASSKKILILEREELMRTKLQYQM